MFLPVCNFSLLYSLLCLQSSAAVCHIGDFFHSITNFLGMITVSMCWICIFNFEGQILHPFNRASKVIEVCNNLLRCSDGGFYHQAGAAVYLAGPPAAGIRIQVEEEKKEEEVSATSPPLSHFSLKTAKFKGRRLCRGGGGGVTERAKGAVGAREVVAV